jgi:hypothetical protein
MTTPEEAARRILEPPKKERPTIAELEAILAAPDGPSVTINPDGSIGVGDSDAVIVARALLASTAREAKLSEALENIKDIATTGRISELVEKFNTMKLIARAALADKETPT